MIREATVADTGALQRMAARFLSKDGPYGNRFTVDPRQVDVLASYMTQQGPDAAVFVAEQDGAVVGMFGVFCLLHPILGLRIASELCWWMEPEARGSRLALSLLRTAEQWAKTSGATWLEMIAPSERVAAFYDRLGYERTDVHYLKTL